MLRKIFEELEFRTLIDRVLKKGSGNSSSPKMCIRDRNVAAICVYPNFAEVVKDTLEVEDVKIACVSAGFPSSQTFIEVKVAETAMAVSYTHLD